MTTTTPTEFQHVTGAPLEGERDTAKAHYLALIDGYTKPEPQPRSAGRRSIEQLLSPVERIQLAHITVQEETAILRANLDAPTVTRSHLARALRSVALIEQAAQEATSYFGLVAHRCRHDDKARRGGRA